MLKATRCRLGLAALAGVLLVSSTSQAQPEPTPAQMLKDFVHYTLIAQPDLASAYAQQLFAAGLSDADLANIIDDSPRHEGCGNVRGIPHSTTDHECEHGESNRDHHQHALVLTEDSER